MTQISQPEWYLFIRCAPNWRADCPGYSICYQHSYNTSKVQYFRFHIFDEAHFSAGPTHSGKTDLWLVALGFTVKTTSMCPIRSWTVDGSRLKTNTRAPLWEWNTLVSTGGRQDFIPRKTAILGGIAAVAGGWFLRFSIRMCIASHWTRWRRVSAARPRTSPNHIDVVRGSELRT